MSIPVHAAPPTTPRELAARRPPGGGASRARPEAPPRAASVARPRRHHLGFVVFSAIVVGLLVVGLVAVNALVAQSSFRIDDLRERVDRLSRHYTLLQVQAARLSAPDRVAEWAERHGLRSPDDGDVHILRVPGRQAAAPASDPGWLDPQRLALKPIVEGGG